VGQRPDRRLAMTAVLPVLCWACGVVPNRNLQPVASFVVVSETHPAGSPDQWSVVFDAGESFDPEGSNPAQGSQPISAWRWDFGDGGSPLTRRTPDAQRTYSDGTYTVTLTVVDNDGEESEPFSRQITLADNRPPIARFTASVQQSAGVFIVSFDAGGSTDPDATTKDPVLYYSWDFGDPPGAFEPARTTPVHQRQYTRGDYVVRLVVSDGRDSSTPAIQGLEVR
jgi:PKD repeat protein